MQPEFWGMQGMRRDFCRPGCGRGLWSPAVGGCSLGVTLRGGPHHHTPAPLGALHPAAPRGSRGHGCTELCPASAPARHRDTARLRHTPTWARSRRGRPPAPASPPCPKATGAKGALAPRPQPQERRGRARSAFSLPSPPHSQAHPILAALQKQTLKFPGLERRAAACGRLAGEGSFPLPS